MKRFTSLALALAFSTSLVACSAGHGSTALPTSTAQSAAKTPKTHVRHLKSEKRTKDVVGGLLSLALDLLDAPLVNADGSQAQFNVGILGVDAIDTNGDSWQLIANSSPNVVNLLTLQQSALALGNGQLPAGSYPQLQLLLDPATTTVILNGTAYPVVFTSPDHPWWDPTQTIEAVNVPLSVSGNSGDSISATLDFNVFQSANISNGIAYVTPVVAAGIGNPAIKGTITNAAGAPVSNATVIATDSNGNVANVTVSGSDGTFTIHGINPGGYTVTVQNTYTTLAGDTVVASGADPGATPSTYVVVGPSDSVNVGTLND